MQLNHTQSPALGFKCRNKRGKQNSLNFHFFSFEKEFPRDKMHRFLWGGKAEMKPPSAFTATVP